MAMIPLVAGLAACDDFGKFPSADTHGELQWEIDRESVAKAGAQLPDINDFLLTITDSKGVTLYDGPYGDSPASLTVPAGSYTISVVSGQFTSPAFAHPVYGDEEVVIIKAGESATVNLNCTLLNCGIRLRIASDFLTSFPGGVMYVKQGAAKLMYAYMEDRIAYFKPGEIAVVLYDEGKEETLFTRTLEPRQILTVSISAPGKADGGASSVRVSLDTSKTWLSENWVIGGENSGGGQGGGSVAEAFSVAEARAKPGQHAVWADG